MTKENKTCIYDNSICFRREYWRNGKLIGYYTKEFLDQAGSIVKVNQQAIKHLCPFQPERLIGAIEARQPATDPATQGNE